MYLFIYCLCPMLTCYTGIPSLFYVHVQEVTALNIQPIEHFLLFSPANCNIRLNSREPTIIVFVNMQIYLKIFKTPDYYLSTCPAPKTQNVNVSQQSVFLD